MAYFDDKQARMQAIGLVIAVLIFVGVCLFLLWH